MSSVAIGLTSNAAKALGRSRLTERQFLAFLGPWNLPTKRLFLRKGQCRNWYSQLLLQIRFFLQSREL